MSALAPLRRTSKGLEVVDRSATQEHEGARDPSQAVFMAYKLRLDVML